ncbi:hypothetical protein BURPS1710b_0712 [Burkholderia pseudomallei 1710b]|uniref:Uncharacterized protein n=1 Tax=Burkholderia pseudomallei (strain 1710b) TaxID=320372 RepID=Q3JWC8_BURP1|nr:hypothetical protein BURPS1710b_0712 [Burkholderia pseudomallei 1710b]
MAGARRRDARVRPVPHAVQRRAAREPARPARADRQRPRHADGVLVARRGAAGHRHRRPDSPRSRLPGRQHARVHVRERAPARRAGGRAAARLAALRDPPRARRRRRRRPRPTRAAARPLRLTDHGSHYATVRRRRPQPALVDARRRADDGRLRIPRDRAHEPVPQGEGRPVGRQPRHRLERDARPRQSARHARRDAARVRHRSVAQARRGRARGDAPSLAGMAAVADPARRAGGAHLRIEARERRAEPARAPVRGRADHGRGAPRRGVREARQREDQRALPDEPLARRAAEGHRHVERARHHEPRHAGARRGNRAVDFPDRRRVQRRSVRQGSVRAHPARRGAPFRGRPAHARPRVFGHDVRRDEGARGIRERGRIGAVRAPVRGRHLGAARLFEAGLRADGARIRGVARAAPLDLPPPRADDPRDRPAHAARAPDLRAARRDRLRRHAARPGHVTPCAQIKRTTGSASTPPRTSCPTRRSRSARGRPATHGRARRSTRSSNRAAGSSTRRRRRARSSSRRARSARSSIRRASRLRRST